jgi:hypothetical protein
MSTVRTEHNQKNPFVMINKRGLEDPELSWPAKGLWAYLLSKPDDWKINITHLSKIYEKKGGGERAIYGLLKELIQHGYCRRDQKKGEDGKFLDYEYVILEFKIKVPHCSEADAHQPHAVERSHTNNESLLKKEKNNKSGAGAPVENADAFRLADLLLNKIIEIKPDVKKPTKNQMETWQADIDKMIRIDKRTPDQIEKVIKWLPSNEFWRKNILCTSKLREKFDKLELNMTEKKSDENVNREWTLKTIENFPVLKKRAEVKGKYVKNIQTGKDICFSNHTPEAFEALFLQIFGGKKE